MDWIGLDGLEISLYSVSDYETLVQDIQSDKGKSSFTVLKERRNQPRTTTIQCQLTYISSTC